MVAPDKHDGLKVLRSMIVLLLLVMFFDGLRAVAKIPGGIAPQREFEVKPKNAALSAEAKDELASVLSASVTTPSLFAFQQNSLISTTVNRCLPC